MCEKKTSDHEAENRETDDRETGRGRNMKIKKAGMLALMLAMLVSLFAGCDKTEGEPYVTGGGKKPGRTSTRSGREEDPAGASGDLTDESALTTPYKQVLQLFRDALDGKDVAGNMLTEAWLSYEYICCMDELTYAAKLYDEPDGGYGYALTDLDGNGVKELLIGRNENVTQTETGDRPSSVSVIAVFTLSDGEEVQAVPVLFGWARSCYYLTKNNTFAHYGSMGAMDGYAGEWEVDYAAVRQKDAGVRICTDPESGDYDAAFYRLRPGADLYEFDEADRITEEEYDAYLERLQADLTTIPLQTIESSYGVPAWTHPATVAGDGAGGDRRDAKTFAETDAYFLGTWDCTTDPGSTLVISPANKQAGGYFLDFFFYRITDATGFANITKDGLSINQGQCGLSAEGTERNASVKGELVRTPTGFTYTITESEAPYLQAGKSYEYVRGDSGSYGMTGSLTGNWECADWADADIRLYTFHGDGTWSGEYADYSGSGNHAAVHGTYEIREFDNYRMELVLFDEYGNKWNEATMTVMESAYGLLFSDTEAVYYRF